MAKRKLSPTVTLNTLKTMIEYMLISNILDRICEMIQKLLEYPRDDTRLDPSGICSKSEHGEQNGKW
jgi:hypothetical protein